MNKENCALKLVDEIILYYDAQSKKHQKRYGVFVDIYDFLKSFVNVETELQTPLCVKALPEHSSNCT